VPEYARTLQEARGGDVRADDMERIARGQAASEDALARNANRVLVADTDPLATLVWSDVLFGAVPPAVRELADSRVADLYLLTDVDVPWVADPVRYLPDGGSAFFRPLSGRNWKLAAGGPSSFAAAGTSDFAPPVAAIEQLLRE